MSAGGGSRPRRFDRRGVLRAGAGLAVLAIAGCGDDDEVAQDATQVPTPDSVPTQAPIGSPVPGYVDVAEKWTGRTLTIAGLGGAYQSAQDEAFFKPFAEATGVDIALDAASIGGLTDQVDDEAVTWDVVDLPTDRVRTLSSADYLSAIDTLLVDTSPLFPEIVGQYAIGAAFFSTVIVYPAAANPPAGWVDFWDPARFPGQRALRKTPIGTMEFALLADGVAPDDLYPLDEERAFRSLDRIKPYVASWYEDGKQPVELIANAEVALASAWNDRAELLDLDEVVRVQWRGGMLSSQSWVVPRGAPNADVAMDFVNFATRAVPNANFARLVPFGPVNRDAFALLRPDRLASLPSAPDHLAVQFLENGNFWAENLDRLQERFDDWVIEELPETPEGEG
ncbi:MAG: hypothetical protein AVDCRST_MAG73-2710 [uncultured Thermomicrobiales bacterium]|uniref:ABC transporter, periplasmic spermidine putrescine-binding protein PotD n=1 Tax=uncultured Thermomicrobiales bacterium TaxID=1645740 RepID=A0A6J4UHP5_9BACT|nr:MAG: hypothetical protein AVDCRST_MAG73-2710 [uncultured Thermomicrobiales bacterium]